MNRRPVNSNYIRLKRTTRRPKDNWRRVKRTKTMAKESNILIIAAALFLLWICSMGIMVSMAWK